MSKLEQSLKQLTEAVTQANNILSKTEQAVNASIDEITSQGVSQDIVIHLKNALKDAKQGKSVSKYSEIIKKATDASKNP